MGRAVEQPGIQASRHRVFTTPRTRRSAYNAHRAAWRLASSVQTPVAYRPADPELGKDIPALDVVASTTEDGERIVLKVVNTSFTEDIQGELKLDHLARSLAREASVTTINGPDGASNSFATPDRSAPEAPLSLAGPQFAYTFEKHSVTIISLSVAR